MKLNLSAYLDQTPILSDWRPCARLWQQQGPEGKDWRSLELGFGARRRWTSSSPEKKGVGGWMVNWASEDAFSRLTRDGEV
jgi:hypothetical protein